jgi:bifunctional UDP-N-acetylglucosamine pyrophosphorylase / glucosamine-1-phosphate N-acetyltransferase
MNIASIVMAAGRGSRMKGYEGNKTLLPLIPGPSPYQGHRSILYHILENLPVGPKAIVVHYKKEDIYELTRGSRVTFCEQPRLNGTGGALLAAKAFIEQADCDHIIVTMGDVPFVRPGTYLKLVGHLDYFSMAVLGFIPHEKKQYGILETRDGEVQRIVEWKYWHNWPKSIQDNLPVCNSGIYAFVKKDLIRFLPVLESRPQRIWKEINGRPIELEEYFITDTVEFMAKDGLKVGYVVAEEETEAMGVDDLDALIRAQKAYADSKDTRP